MTPNTLFIQELPETEGDLTETFLGCPNCAERLKQDLENADRAIKEAIEVSEHAEKVGLEIERERADRRNLSEFNNAPYLKQDSGKAVEKLAGVRY